LSEINQSLSIRAC